MLAPSPVQLSPDPMLTDDLMVAKITVAQFESLYPDETNQIIELLDGEIFVMPSPTPLHQDVVVELAGLLREVIKPNQLGRLQVAPSEIYLDDHNIVQPDLFFVANTNDQCFVNERNRWQGAPDLCIEVLSPSTAKHDKQAKFSLYEQFGVKEYWLVDPVYETVEIFVGGENGYQRQGVYAGEDVLGSSVLPALAIPTKNIFA